MSTRVDPNSTQTRVFLGVRFRVQPDLTWTRLKEKVNNIQRLISLCKSSRKFIHQFQLGTKLFNQNIHVRTHEFQSGDMIFYPPEVLFTSLPTLQPNKRELYQYLCSIIFLQRKFHILNKWTYSAYKEPSESWIHSSLLGRDRVHTHTKKLSEIEKNIVHLLIFPVFLLQKSP